MRTSVSLLAIVFALTAAVPNAHAQSAHAASTAAMDAALQQHVSAAASDREMVLKLLEREEVKAVAAKAGLDVRRAATAVSTLEGQDLADVAAQARQVDRALAGGQSRVVISTTAIIIGLLVLILIILAVD
jgi:hypothetical protein